MKKLTFTFLFMMISIAMFSQTKVGIQAAYGTSAEFGIGAKATFRITDKFHASPSFNYFFGESTQGASSSLIGINADAHYVLSQKDGLSLYPLAGLNVTRSSASAFGFSASVTEIGFNVGGGLNYNLSSSLTGVFEAKYVLSAFDQALFSIGVMYNL
ncbi:outer membrane beta-barrel protein [Tenacibaculum jejuense]|uniref:Putative Opacity family porin protein n=1 Tax=Tenacibaculum jejuense TaxID=584609 RepID=A0A238U795_9FLAO|nr:outer membrane beta-barrel protein [Tenacibaculum jejuense]SNR15071.1 putative Opacity family porin protein [Tenacibaculum jejuense]